MDGKARLPGLFRHYFNADTHGANDRTVAYLEHIGQCFMVSAVARIRQPGCKVDYLPVLVGKQGTRAKQSRRSAGTMLGSATIYRPSGGARHQR